MKWSNLEEIYFCIWNNFSVFISFLVHISNVVWDSRTWNANGVFIDMCKVNVCMYWTIWLHRQISDPINLLQIRSSCAAMNENWNKKNTVIQHSGFMYIHRFVTCITTFIATVCGLACGKVFKSLVSKALSFTLAPLIHRFIKVFPVYGSWTTIHMGPRSLTVSTGSAHLLPVLHERWWWPPMKDIPDILDLYPHSECHCGAHTTKIGVLAKIFCDSTLVFYGASGVILIN